MSKYYMMNVSTVDHGPEVVLAVEGEQHVRVGDKVRISWDYSYGKDADCAETEDVNIDGFAMCYDLHGKPCWYIDFGDYCAETRSEFFTIEINAITNIERLPEDAIVLQSTYGERKEAGPKFNVPPR